MSTFDLSGGSNDLTSVLEACSGLTNDDTYLRSLVTKMPDYLKASKSNNTTKKYELYLKKFKDFMISRGKQYLPAKDFLVSLFVVHLIDTNVSHNVINSYIYSIKWMHKLYGYADPTDNMHVKDLLSTSNRRPGKPCLKKDVIETSYIISG